jgi:hypothetical protein
MDTLFDADQYGEPEPRRREPTGLAHPMVVPRPAGYHLITTRSGVQGFHRTKLPEAALAAYGTVVTLCGITGRRLDEYPAQIPLCQRCELIRQVQ